MADCARYVELLSARLDGELTPAEERELEAHLAVCPACRALEEQLAELRKGFDGLEEVPAPEGFARGVMDRIRAQEDRPKVVPLFRRPQIRALAGLAACLVLCVGLYQSGLLGRWGQGSDSVDNIRSAGDASVSAGEDGTVQPQISAYGGEEPEPHVDASLAQADGLQGREAEYTTLTLSALPEGAEEILGQEVQWTADEAGDLCCQVEAEQLAALEALAQEQGITAARSAGGEDGQYTLVLTQP